VGGGDGGRTHQHLPSCFLEEEKNLSRFRNIAAEQHYAAPAPRKGENINGSGLYFLAYLFNIKINNSNFMRLRLLQEKLNEALYCFVLFFGNKSAKNAKKD
jgi:hypothetical protein